MATIANLRTQVAALVAAAQPRPGRPHRRTTAEGRQEIDRILQAIANPRPPTLDELRECAESYAELDLVIARLDRDDAEAAMNSRNEQQSTTNERQ